MFLTEKKNFLILKKKNVTGSAVYQGNDTGAIVSFETSGKISYFCDDVYLIATVENFHLRTFFFPGSHEIDWEGGFTDAELFDVLKNGFRVFKVKNLQKILYFE